MIAELNVDLCHHGLGCRLHLEQVLLLVHVDIVKHVCSVCVCGFACRDELEDITQGELHGAVIKFDPVTGVVIPESVVVSAVECLSMMHCNVPQLILGGNVPLCILVLVGTDVELAWQCYPVHGFWSPKDLGPVEAESEDWWGSVDPVLTNDGAIRHIHLHRLKVLTQTVLQGSDGLVVTRNHEHTLRDYSSIRVPRGNRGLRLGKLHQCMEISEGRFGKVVVEECEEGKVELALILLSTIRP